ncbi:MAG: signal recognition particle [Pseudomonadota bacterium]
MKLFSLALILMATSATAQMAELENMQRAMELGQIIASEKPCGLTFDQSAISAWIDTNVPADDMGFTSNLQMGSMSMEMELTSMSDSLKTAHCRAIERTARHFGFITE